MELLVYVCIIKYLLFGYLFNIIFTEIFHIHNKKTGKPIHPAMVTLICFYWIFMVPILMYSTWKIRKEENEDDM